MQPCTVDNPHRIFDSLHRTFHNPHRTLWRVKRLLLIRGLPGSSAGKKSACNDPSSIPGSERPAGEEIGYTLQYSWASLVAQMVKNMPAVWETWSQSLDWEDPLEKGTATHSIFWTGEYHGQRSLAGHSPWSRNESDTTKQLSL